MPTICRRLPAMIARVLAVILLGVSVTHGQSLPGSDQAPTDGGRPKSTQVGFFELLESGGDAFLDLFKSNHEQATVEHPQWNSLKSPRDTVMTFIEAMNHVARGRTEALPRAIKTFGKFDEDRAKTVAGHLADVFDRMPEISPGTLPGEKMVRDQDISRYELFPRGMENSWAYKAIGEAPGGQIVLVKWENLWTFDESTLEGAEDLAKSFQVVPPRPRAKRQGELFLNVVSPTFFRTTAMQWLQCLLWLAGGVGLAWLLYRVVGKWIKERNRRGDDMLTPLLRSVLVPAIILSVVVAIAIGSARIYLHPALSGFRWNIIEALIVLAGVFLFVSLLELACLGIRRSLFGDDDPYARMMSMVVRRGLRVFATIVLLLFVFQNVFHWNVTAMIGGFGILALALSLAAQDAVKNLFGAMTIFANRPFINGDWVRFGDNLGTVEDVSLQVTRIRLLSGEVLSVPNMKFIDESVENLSMRKYLRRVMNIQITYDTPAEKVREAMAILRDILESPDVVGDGKGDLETNPPRVWFDQFGPHYLNLRADYWYLMKTDEGPIQRDTERGWFSYLDHATLVNQKVLERFNEAGIDFAFPTQTVYLTDDPDRRMTLQTASGDPAFDG